MQIYFFAAIFAYLFIYLFFLQGVPFILTTIVALVWVTLNNPYSLCKYVFVHSGYDDIILFLPLKPVNRKPCDAGNFIGQLNCTVTWKKRRFLRGAV